MSGRAQKDVCPTHARGATLAHVVIDVHDLVWVTIVAPIGYSVNSSLSLSFLWHRLVQTCVFIGKFSRNNKFNGI